MSNKNLQSLEKIQRDYYRMHGLQKITAALSTATTKKDIARVIFNEGFNLLHAENGDVLIFTDEKQEKFEVLVFKGYPQTFIADFKEKDNNTPLLTYQVAQSKKPLYISTVTRIPMKYKVAKSYFRLTKCSSAVLLPLLVNNTTIGVMEFSFKKSRVFTKEDKEFMETLANQCAQAFERVTAIENLKQSKEELEVILKNIADGITVQDTTGKLIYANNASILANGYRSVEAMLNAGLLDYVTRFDFYDEAGNSFSPSQLPGRQAMAKGKDLSVTIQLVEKKTHISRWINIKSTPIPDAKGNARLVVNVMHDMTREKELEQRKDDFISMASHELKTPLTTLKVFAQVLKKKFDEKDTDTLFEKMDGQINKLNDLVTQLLDITRIQQGKLGIRKSTFSIRDLVVDIVDSMQSTTSHTIKIQDCIPLLVSADRDRIGQVVTNLLINAIKYSPKAKKIIVSIQKKSKEVVISVKDFGIGIPEEDQNKVFDRFYRTEAEEKTYPGLGLGLYISSEIIKQHSGKIWVKSKLGKGSTFYFSLPL